MIGKEIRLERIINRDSGKTVIVPMDHGVTVGPIKGLINMAETVNRIAEGGANAVVLHKGIVTSGHRGKGKDIGLIIHLSASTTLAPDPNNKINICTVEEAIKLGADAVSVHVNIGANTEADMLHDLGETSRKCNEWSIPLLAMLYPRGEKIKDEKDLQYVKLAARVGAELGADIIKTVYTGSPETFREVVEGCPVPVVIAGGSKLSDEETLKMIEGAMKAGASGLSMGRNAFQHQDPTKLVKAACAIVHKGKTADEAALLLK